MRALALIACTAACSFAPGASSGDGGAGGDGAQVDHDAQAGHDAHVVAIDAPPCPDGDMDGDGICNSVDTWNCGPLPPSPASTVSWSLVLDSWSASSVSIANLGQVVQLHRGAPMRIQFHYSISVGCGLSDSCNAQLQYGLDPGDKLGCAFAGTPDSLATNSSNFDSTTTAPDPGSHPKEIDLKLGIGRQSGCLSYWYSFVVPDDASTIARICVLP